MKTTQRRLRSFLEALSGFAELFERWEERAAILEFDAGLTRAQADRESLALMVRRGDVVALQGGLF